MTADEIVTQWYDGTWTAPEVQADIEAMLLAATGDERYSRGAAQFVIDAVVLGVEETHQK
jgi:hypothetical protein